MSKLTAEIKNAGLHDCSCNCYAISEKEAIKAIGLVKIACIEALKEMECTNDHGDRVIYFDDIITAIESVK